MGFQKPNELRQALAKALNRLATPGVEKPRQEKASVFHTRVRWQRGGKICFAHYATESVDLFLRLKSAIEPRNLWRCSFVTIRNVSVEIIDLKRRLAGTSDFPIALNVS